MARVSGADGLRPAKRNLMAAGTDWRDIEVPRGGLGAGKGGEGGLH